MNATIPPSTVTPKNLPPAAPPPQPPAPSLSTARILTAVITKELRHHGIYTAFLYVLGIILCFATSTWINAFRMYSLSGNGYPGHNFLSSYLWINFSAVIFPCAGLFFGIAQASADHNFDLWAFLIHRPVPRATLFLGRILAGFILYFASVGIPLLIAFIIAAYVGDFFHWRFMLPSIADFLTGLIYYFAGLLIVTRRALLFGSRFIPVFVALACSVGVVSVPYFSVALALILLAMALFAIAALGAYLSHGFTLPVPSIPRLANNLILLLACTITLLVIFLSPTLATLSLVRNSIPEPVESFSAGTETFHFLTADGTLVKDVHPFAARSADRNASTEYLPAHYYDMEGHEIPKPPRPTRPVSTDSEDQPSTTFGLKYRYYNPEYYNFSHDYRNTSALVAYDGVSHLENNKTNHLIERWYYAVPDGLFYGYDADTNRFLGIIGQNGFSQSKSTAIPWQETNSLYPKKRGEFLMTDQQLFSLDLEHRSVELLFTTPPDERLLGFDTRILEAVPGGTATQPTSIPVEIGLFVRTSRSIYLFRGNYADGDRYLHATPIKFPLEKTDTFSYIGVDWFKSTNRIALTYRTYDDHSFSDPDPSARLSPNAPAIVDIFDYQTGAPVAHYDLPDYVAVDPPRFSAPPIPAYYAPSIGAILGTFNAVANPLYLVPIRYFYKVFSPNNVYPDYSWQGRRAIPVLERFNDGANQSVRLSVMFLILLTTAAFTRLLATRYHLRHPNLWALLALLCGPAALLTLIAANYLPVRTTCPTCHKKRPVHEPICPHCRAPFPPPAATNTEIFA